MEHIRGNAFSQLRRRECSDDRLRRGLYESRLEPNSGAAGILRTKGRIVPHG